MSKDVVSPGEQIIFNNTSSDAYAYEWSFGDGTTSDEKDPSHAFENEGSYDVMLTAFSKNEKKTDSYSSTLTVKQQNEILFSGYRFPLSKGYLEYIVNASPDYNLDIYIVSDGITVSNRVPSGTGNMIYLRAWTNSPDEITSGAYSFDDSNIVGTFSMGVLAVEHNFDISAGGAIASCIDGNFQVSRNGSYYVLDVSLTFEGNVIGTGHYEGTFVYTNLTEKGVKRFDFFSKN
jgi:PKD repeat protein